jgi:DNA-binding response OmpR family regulator
MKPFPATTRTLHEGSLPSPNATQDRTRNGEMNSIAHREEFSTSQNQPLSANGHNNILIVDDDASVRDILGTFLRRSGYRVSSANDGEAGWEALCANSFNALITDHDMPRLTGLDLLRRVRSGPLRVLPTILISGEMPWGEKDLLDLVWPGVAMEKPFSLLELLTSVRGVLTMTTHAEPAYA